MWHIWYPRQQRLPAATSQNRLFAWQRGNCELMLAGANYWETSHVAYLVSQAWRGATPNVPSIPARRYRCKALKTARCPHRRRSAAAAKLATNQRRANRPTRHIVRPLLTVWRGQLNFLPESLEVSGFTISLVFLVLLVSSYSEKANANFAAL